MKAIIYIARQQNTTPNSVRRSHYMSILRSILLALLIVAAGCKNDEAYIEQYVPTDVLVKIKANYTIDKVFHFINSFDHDVENIHALVYTADLPPDSLQYVLNYLNAKPYANDGKSWPVHGYLDYHTRQITIFPRLLNMKNAEYQKDWLESIDLLKLTQRTETETGSCIIYFHVPKGEEKLWEKKFEEFDFVEWAELNRILQINTWPN